LIRSLEVVLPLPRSGGVFHIEDVPVALSRQIPSIAAICQGVLNAPVSRLLAFWSPHTWLGDVLRWKWPRFWACPTWHQATTESV